MEVYVYADEVDVRLHEGSFLITTTNDTLKSFFKEKILNIQKMILMNG